AVDEEDAARRRRRFREPALFLAPVGVCGKARHLQYGRAHRNHPAVQLDLLRAVLQPPAARLLGLIADQEHRGSGIRQVPVEVAEDASAGRHAARGYDWEEPGAVEEFRRLLLAAHE